LDVFPLSIWGSSARRADPQEQHGTASAPSSVLDRTRHAALGLRPWFRLRVARRRQAGHGSWFEGRRLFVRQPDAAHLPVGAWTPEGEDLSRIRVVDNPQFPAQSGERWASNWSGFSHASMKNHSILPSPWKGRFARSEPSDRDRIDYHTMHNVNYSCRLKNAVILGVSEIRMSENSESACLTTQKITPYGKRRLLSWCCSW